ncbi:fused DSP-PTPase phosphatase/NAD kinase-like protein [Solilutibacter silvestris]|nr:tyrosine-protein phosphatase [Lysobacter silvestris]
MTTPAIDIAQRPATWAQPVANAELHNLHRVTPTMWRSSLPDAQGFAAANALGIHTIVNLRPMPDIVPGPKHAALEHIPVWTWHVTDGEILDFLRIASDPSKQPVLVHCQHGADRTGVMVAAYRVVVQDWNKEDAIREMQRGGYGYHAIWTNLPGVIRKLDVAKMRSRLHSSQTP